MTILLRIPFVYSKLAKLRCWTLSTWLLRKVFCLPIHVYRLGAFVGSIWLARQIMDITIDGSALVGELNTQHKRSEGPWQRYTGNWSSMALSNA